MPPKVPLTGTCLPLQLAPRRRELLDRRATRRAAPGVDLAAVAHVEVAVTVHEALLPLRHGRVIHWSLPSPHLLPHRKARQLRVTQLRQQVVPGVDPDDLVMAHRISLAQLALRLLEED